jgi:hypothetical protein
MRLVLFSLGAFVLIALVAIIHDTYMRPHGPEFIVISIQDEATGERNETLSGMGTDQMGKCFYGPVSWKSKMKLEEVDCWVKEPPTDPDHPTVLAHFVIKEAGVTTEIDQTLPVLDITPSLPWDKPDTKQWSKLDGHFKAVAYRCGTMS